MGKILIITGLIGSLILFLFYIYKEGENKGTIEEVKKQQEVTIKLKDEIIETKKYQKKLISKSATSSDIVYRNKWLQLVYQKRNLADSSK